MKHVICPKNVKNAVCAHFDVFNISTYKAFCKYWDFT